MDFTEALKIISLFDSYKTPVQLSTLIIDLFKLKGKFRSNNLSVITSTFYALAFLTDTVVAVTSLSRIQQPWVLLRYENFWKFSPTVTVMLELSSASVLM